MTGQKHAEIDRQIAEVELLREWGIWVIRDPRLNVWEHDFAKTIYWNLDAPYRQFLSPKQKAIVWKLAVKTRFRGLSPDDANAETEPDGEDQEE